MWSLVPWTVVIVLVTLNWVYSSLLVETFVMSSIYSPTYVYKLCLAQMNHLQKLRDGKSFSSLVWQIIHAYIPMLSKPAETSWFLECCTQYHFEKHCFPFVQPIFWNRYYVSPYVRRVPISFKFRGWHYSCTTEYTLSANVAYLWTN